MPMRFTDDDVQSRLRMHRLDASGTPEECRERLACYVEQEFGDYLEGWQIKTGRPWTEMTRQEAEEMCRRVPEMAQNAGVKARLAS